MEHTSHIFEQQLSGQHHSNNNNNNMADDLEPLAMVAKDVTTTTDGNDDDFGHAPQISLEYDTVDTANQQQTMDSFQNISRQLNDCNAGDMAAEPTAVAAGLEHTMVSDTTSAAAPLSVAPIDSSMVSNGIVENAEHLLYQEASYRDNSEQQHLLPGDATNEQSANGILTTDDYNNNPQGSALEQQQLDTMMEPIPLHQAASSETQITPLPLSTTPTTQHNHGLSNQNDNNNNHMDVVELDEVESEKQQPMVKKARTDSSIVVPSSGALAAHLARQQHRPQWMQQQQQQPDTTAAMPGQNIAMPNQQEQQYQSMATPPQQQTQPNLMYMKLPPEFQPTWSNLFPVAPRLPPPTQSAPQARRFQLSLLNVNEFTISGLPVSYDGPPSTVAGLRKEIKSIARDHGGNAVYDRDKEGGGGKWRIPLAAYQAFFAFLVQDGRTKIEGIPATQLKIASLERARQEKGYPTSERLIELGVPVGLAETLAPFQRGGVDFVFEKEGRALIADDMGLGKTIQSIASMSIYRNEWPLLVLTPSTARFHWENEFLNWLGQDSEVNDKGDGQRDLTLLTKSNINVLTSGSDDILPTEHTKVVICSYGLIARLVEDGRIYPRQFKCAIVDESHMLKNKNAKRTAALMPVLNATDRCILLSGTPALSRPMELWPQLFILGTEKHGWWNDEQDFVQKYVKSTRASRKAELHTLLIGTVMIRRLKSEMLKSLLPKSREQASINVLHEEERDEFQRLLMELRKGKGALGKMAKSQLQADKLQGTHNYASMDPDLESSSRHRITADALPGKESSSVSTRNATATADLREQMQQEYIAGSRHIAENLARYDQPAEIRAQVETQLLGNLRSEIEQKHHEQMNMIRQQNPSSASEPEEESRNSVLTRLYSLTGDVKIPLVVDMLKNWLNDPTKGKVCIFAHHLTVLDAIRDQGGLDNSESSMQKYIRIDGKVSPKSRQEQINAFQTDPSVRVALLGITAAGVAVTLTAASNVWFAELFWTPALMIQAEDRCHRIGQQAQVKCLYFVARGTLDEVLWRLIEKKFRDLGEFVEGKEKQKIVIDKKYKTLKELRALFMTNKTSSDQDDDSVEGAFADQDLDINDQEFFGDIAKFGAEERLMLREADDEDGDGGTPVDDEYKVSTSEAAENGPGQSEADAICLDDSDDEDATPDESKRVDSKPSLTRDSLSGQASSPTAGANPYDICLAGTIASPRLFRMEFRGKSLGIELIFHKQRAVVAKRAEHLIAKYGQQCKPAVGAIIVQVNQFIVSLAGSIEPLCQYIRKNLRQGHPVVISFCEDEAFSQSFAAYYAAKQARSAKQPPVVVDSPDVIEID